MNATVGIITAISKPYGGVFTRSAAGASGVTRSAIRNLEARGLIHRLHRRTYFYGSVVTLEARRWAAVLAAGSDSLIAGDAALDEHGLLPRPSESVEVLVTRRCRPLDGVRIIHTSTLHAEDRRVSYRQEMPVTSVERTLVDIADRYSVLELCRMLREAAFRRRLNIARLRRTIVRNQRRSGIAKLRSALDQHLQGHGGVDSTGEQSLARMLRRAGIEFACNVHLVVHGERIRVDVYIEHLGLVVEYDPRNHDLAPMTREDSLRDALCRAANLDIVRVRANRKRRGVALIKERHQSWVARGRPPAPPLAVGATIHDNP